MKKIVIVGCFLLLVFGAIAATARMEAGRAKIVSEMPVLPIDLTMPSNSSDLGPIPSNSPLSSIYHVNTPELCQVALNFLRTSAGTGTTRQLVTRWAWWFATLLLLLALALSRRFQARYYETASHWNIEWLSACVEVRAGPCVLA